MRLYLEFIKNSIQANCRYRFNLFIKLFNRVITLFINVAIWKALYGMQTETTSNMGSVSIGDMIMYSIISSAISVLITNDLIGNMDDKIRTGQIAMDLIKPLDFKVWQFCDVIGKNAANIVLELAPVLLIAGVTFGFQAPSINYLLLFFIALFNSIVINFFITFIISLFGFWYMEVWHFERLLKDVVKLFSGAWIPIWFFPKFLVNISEVLPFKSIYFVPTTIYLAKVDYMQAITMVLQQFMWILILFILDKVLWGKAIKKLVIQGG